MSVYVSFGLTLPLRAQTLHVYTHTNTNTQGGSSSVLPFLQRDSASSLTPGAGTSTAGGSLSSSSPAAGGGSSKPEQQQQQSEAERLAAAKSTKELLSKGISLFNTKGPLKGIESLMSNGLLESSPSAVSGCVGLSWVWRWGWGWSWLWRAGLTAGERVVGAWRRGKSLTAGM